MTNWQSVVPGRKGFQRVPVVDRFWARVDKRGPDECWPWKGAKACKEGYGRIFIDGRSVPAHRFSWELANGMTMPKAAYACHRCDNPDCVNPAHIWPGTPSQNMADAYRKGRTTVVKGNNKPRDFCRKGHPMSGENLYVSKVTGFRRCYQCKVEGDRERRHRARIDAFLNPPPAPEEKP